MEKNENRRVRMTKRLMKEALLELLEHQNLTSISVTAVCETADVHRSTFYNYYTDPANLLEEIETEFLNRIPTPPQVLDQQNQKTLLEATTDFFDFIQDNKKTIRILLSESSGSNFAVRLVDHLCNGYIYVGDKTDEMSADYIRLYIANGSVGLLREWVNEDFPVSSQKFAEMMYTLSRRVFQY
ncbi:MAG: TetR/AcrR family transcriptional regulator C-terminal domain-containing protein [Anaerolineaceae bacterium]|nr:TetR/AcrR family transcriptional regulator C-terminal domain-containing protein [Anaerolineaceae bacterium]